MDTFSLEVCVDSVESAIAAEKGGADRVELCSNLIIGGTTPTEELFLLVKEAVSIPVHVLIRPRFGDFLYFPYEIEEMKRSVEKFVSIGADGIVIGMLRPDGTLDTAGMKYLLENVSAHQNSTGARAFRLTLHRAFDMCKDPYEAYEQSKELGFDYILTSGQKNSSMDGIELLEKLCHLSKTSIEDKSTTAEPQIMAGGGIRSASDVKDLCKIGIRNIHLSGKVNYESGMIYRNENVNMGLATISEYTRWKTSEEIIRSVADLKR